MKKLHPLLSVLLLITGTVWAQTGLDKLVLKNGTEYFGKYLKMNHNLTKIYFKPQGTYEGQPVPIKLLHTLQLKDGRVLIHKGSIRGKTFFNSLEYEKLTVEQKAVYNDLKKRHLIQNITCFSIILVLIPLMFILGGGSGGGSGGSGKVFLGDGPPI